MGLRIFSCRVSAHINRDQVIHLIPADTNVITGEICRRAGMVGDDLDFIAHLQGRLTVDMELAHLFGQALHYQFGMSLHSAVSNDGTVAVSSLIQT